MLQMEALTNQQKGTFAKRARTIMETYNLPSHWQVLSQPPIQTLLWSSTKVIVNPHCDLLSHFAELRAPPRQKVPLHQWIQKSQTSRLCQSPVARKRSNHKSYNLLSQYSQQNYKQSYSQYSTLHRILTMQHHMHKFAL